MITGAHVVLYSSNADADRTFLLDLLGTRSVDAGGGWLIVALPPAEVAVHPTDGDSQHQLYLMCDDIQATVSELSARGIRFEGGITDEGWGLLATLRLPGGGPLGIYEPRHPLAADAESSTVARALGPQGIDTRSALRPPTP